MATIARIHDRAAVNVGAGVAGGILGGIFIDAFLTLANQTPIVAIWQFIASTLVGPAAFTSPSYAVLGFAMHFAISIVWGVIFAVLASGPIRALVRRPWLAGIAYGIVVMIAMTTGLALAHVGGGAAPSTAMLVKSLIAHTLFFGVPVALYVASVENKKRTA
jgi:hypothetical protein